MARPAHAATTRHLGALYPFMVEPGLGSPGVLVGRDLLGESFVYDPFELYRRGVLTNPNMVVFGQIGRGKSAFVKTYLWRQLAFGRRAWVLDPKGEYGALCASSEGTLLALRPGGQLRLNPLDVSNCGATRAVAADEAVRRRAELLSSLAAAGLGRGLLPTERTAIELAVASVSSRCRRGAAPTLPQVVDEILDPSDASAASICCTRDVLIADGRHVGLELRRLVAGDLRGMFDGPTSSGIDLGSSLVVLDLSALYRSPALGILMTCAAAWMANAVSSAGAEGLQSLVVVDEAWAILADPGVARWLQSSWKLSRAWGVSNVAVLHRVSDLRSAGAAGSMEAGLAEGLLADSETRVVYGQPPGELADAARALGLSDTEVEVVSRLQRGVALWRVGSRSFMVSHLIGPYERSFVDTDAAMVGGATRFEPRRDAEFFDHERDAHRDPWGSEGDGNRAPR